MNPAGSSVARPRLALIALGLAAAATAPLEAAGPEIRLGTGAEGAATVEAVGLDRATLDRLRSAELSYEDWAAFFPVTTGGSEEEEQPTVWGRYAVDGDRVRFTPRFPLVAGQPYIARWASGDGATIEATLTLPRPPSEPTTEVVAVYPSAGELPANLLKLYLHFSAPMSRGEARHHLRLLTARGREVPAPVVAPEHELWNPATDRLTLFLDPGRIKRGVGPHEELGPPLEEGGGYRLLIGRGWRDARGEPLKAGFSKVFRVVAADREQPRPEGWRLSAPTGPGEPLRLSFPEPLDRALLERLVAVVDERGERVPGAVAIDRQETRWSFRPASPWRPGSYQLRVGTALEDLAGNSLRRPFETEMGLRPAAEPAAVHLPFTVP